MKKEDIIIYGLSLPNTCQDCPFTRGNPAITLKHKETGKWFALLMNVNHSFYVNVKTDPHYSELLRKQYEYIIPAYHMNKEHWNTIIIRETCDENLIKELILHSYELTK